MANVLPFQKTQLLINEIDEFLDKVSEASMLVEKTIEHYIAQGPDELLEDRLEQIFTIEARADEVRRSIATVMYTQMLMPDTRGDILNLLNDLDNVVDDSTHFIAGIAIGRPEIPSEFHAGFEELTQEVMKSTQFMIQAARAYFK